MAVQHGYLRPRIDGAYGFAQVMGPAGTGLDSEPKLCLVTLGMDLVVFEFDHSHAIHDNQ